MKNRFDPLYHYRVMRHTEHYSPRNAMIDVLVHFCTWKELLERGNRIQKVLNRFDKEKEQIVK